MCDHVWPSELLPETQCRHCGMEFGEWMEELD